MHKLQCMLFDLDDTLVDSDLLRIEALKQCGHPDPVSLPLEELRFRSPVALMRPHGGINMNKYWKQYISVAQKQAQLTSDKLPLVLAQLKSSGKKLGVVTSSPGRIAHSVLCVVKLIEFFDSCLIGYEYFRRNKEKGILEALLRLNALPEVTGYVGDSIHDSEASDMTGVYFFLAAWNCKILNEQLKKTATKVIKDVQDLLTL